MRGDFREGRTVPADEANEQLRLTSELPEIRMWWKRASRKGACGHDELLSGHRLRGCRGARCRGFRGLLAADMLRRVRS